MTAYSVQCTVYIILFYNAVVKSRTITCSSELVSVNVFDCIVQKHTQRQNLGHVLINLFV